MGRSDKIGFWNTLGFHIHQHIGSEIKWMMVMTCRPGGATSHISAWRPFCCQIPYRTLVSCSGVARRQKQDQSDECGCWPSSSCRMWVQGTVTYGCLRGKPSVYQIQTRKPHTCTQTDVNGITQTSVFYLYLQIYRSWGIIHHHFNVVKYLWIRSRETLHLAGSWSVWNEAVFGMIM